jgi:hypothetical protein
MKKRGFGLIVILLVLLSVLFYITLPSNDSDLREETLAIFEDIKGEKIHTLVISSGEVSLSVKQADDIWTLPQKDSYPADHTKVHSLLLKLLSLEVSHQVRTTESKFSALGVSDSAVESKDAVKVSLFDGEQSPAAVIYLGNKRENSSGQYIRRANKRSVYVIPEAIEVTADVNDWLRSTVVNILASKVLSITQVAIDEEQQKIEFNLQREGKGKLEYVGTVADDKKVDQAIVQQVSSGLQGLKISDVKKSSGNFSPQFKTIFALDDASIYEIRSKLEDGKYFAEIHVSLDEPFAKDLENRQKELLAKEKNEAGETAEPTKSSSISIATKEDVERLNSQFSNWTFELPEFMGKKFQQSITALITDV